MDVAERACKPLGETSLSAFSTRRSAGCGQASTIHFHVAVQGVSAEGASETGNSQFGHTSDSFAHSQSRPGQLRRSCHTARSARCGPLKANATITLCRVPHLKESGG
ncbi:hypothetical protein DPMN_085095 [Dreissena polymorpha]|uniref:Uncharacterized protein n=1 Tax=Dreissena polymorpha TaxID=45954 RepID=A0A9D3YFS9_DREPO|nr:hypothetical protein DPMN_085095 [Dreissena polymorpha]